MSGYSGFSSVSGYSGYSGPAGGGGLSKLLITQNHDFALVANTVVSKAGTITGTAGVGSSLFLNRLFVPANMTLTEVDMAFGLGFNLTSNGAGTMSRSLAIYSFGNSTSLATVASISGSSSWNTGTVTAGGSTSLTQFQAGWGGGGLVTPFIQPMTFNSTSLAAGEYVIGQLFDFAQATSTWSLSIYGQVPTRSASINIVSSVLTDSLGALSSGGLATVSAFTGSGTVSALSNAGTLAINNYELSSNSFAGSAASAIATATAISTKTFSIQSRTIFSAAPSTAGVMLSTAMITGSLHTSSASFAALTLALNQFVTVTYARSGGSIFNFVGTGSALSQFPYYFSAGIMSTGAIPTAITLTSTAVTYTGSAAYMQPWFALMGS